MVGPVETDVVVIGAGVSGLTTGICLAQSGLTVRVLAKDPPARTTSALAGASWGPYLVSDSRVLRWSEITLTELESVARDSQAGVRLTDGMDATTDHVDAPAWAQRVSGFRRCEPDELPPGYATGWRYIIPIVNMPTYLAYLERRLADLGTTVEIATVRRFADVAHLAPVIVNCAGLGARELVPDEDVSPTRGQLVVVKNPGVDWFFQDQSEDGPDLTYFLPHGDHVVLGGSALPGVEDASADPEIAAKIIERCARIEPLFRDAEKIGDRVGFRPMRAQVRVEREGAIVHNYGHGGSGLSLSWGCAQEVLAKVSGR